MGMGVTGTFPDGIPGLPSPALTSQGTWDNHSSVKTINGTYVNVTTTTIAGSLVGVEEDEEVKEGFMSDEVRHFLEIMNFVILSGIIAFCGCVFNIINIIVFVRQGLNDSITISLLALAVSDFGALVTLVWMSICFNPYFAESDIPFNSPKVQYLTAGWPHVCFARITSFITAYITFERCTCIVMPLKVRNIFTPRRSFGVMVFIFLFQIAIVAPVYYGIRLDWVFNEAKNRSLIDLSYVEDGPFIENISFSFNIATQILAVVAVSVFSLVLIHALLRKSKWRKRATSGSMEKTAANNKKNDSSDCGGDGGGGESSSANKSLMRDRKVVKMVLFLAIIFIICFTPTVINLIVMISMAEYSIVGRYKNMFQAGWSLLNTLEAVNSTINIFVYLKMSTRYRKEFQRLFCRDKLLLTTDASITQSSDAPPSDGTNQN